MPITPDPTRLAFLEAIRDSGVPCPIEKLLKAGFPRSSIYPAYWYGAAPGARLAFVVGCRVTYSTKCMAIELAPLTADERKLAQIRMDRAKQKAAERTANILRHLKDYVDEHDELEDSESGV